MVLMKQEVMERQWR